MFVNMSAGSLCCVAGWTHHCVGCDMRFKVSCAVVFYGVTDFVGHNRRSDRY
jgi:hypothetical protein